MRIFVPRGIRDVVFWMIQGLIALNVCFYLANELTIAFQCNPIAKAWDSSIPGKCILTSLNPIITSVINVLSDVLILALPIWAIWHLQKVPTKKKLSVSAIFATGILYVPIDCLSRCSDVANTCSAVFTAVMRLVSSISLATATDLTFARLQNQMWTYVSPPRFALTVRLTYFNRLGEITAIMICASLPLVPQFTKFTRRARYPMITSSSHPSYPSKPTAFHSSATGRGRKTALSSVGETYDGSSKSRETSTHVVVLDVTGPDKELATESRQEEWAAVPDGVQAFGTPEPVDLEAGEQGIVRTVRIEQSY